VSRQGGTWRPASRFVSWHTNWGNPRINWVGKSWKAEDLKQIMQSAVCATESSPRSRNNATLTFPCACVMFLRHNRVGNSWLCVRNCCTRGTAKRQRLGAFWEVFGLQRAGVTRRFDSFHIPHVWFKDYVLFPFFCFDAFSTAWVI
jgi:hypothetical protein